MPNMENNGTQNAHIQKARENAIAYYYEHHRDNKPMRDLSMCRTTEERRLKMLNKEKYMDELFKFACRKREECGFAVLKTGELVSCDDTECGRCKFSGVLEDCDKVRMKWLEQEYVDWSKVPVDTPILVRDYENREWTRRYFARYVDGRVLTWSAGATSWSTDYKGVVPWQYAKLAESEE